jgi:hypothetical protein
MSASPEGIRFAGDVNIDKIEIISNNGFSQEITNQVIALEIYEDMFSPFISGVLAVKDSLDFTNLFPFVGEEFVNIKIRTPSFNEKTKIIDDQFYIFKVNNRIKVGDRATAYEIHFFSREAMVDLNKKVSRAYEGKVSDIAKAIITDGTHGLESKKTYVIEDTPNGGKFISNFWSPVKNINYISENATNKNGAASYLFFENRKGFNFVSTEYLYKQEQLQDFVYDNYMRDFKQDGTSTRNVEKEYKRIIDINIPLLYDYIDRSRLGLYASKMIAYDMTTKKYIAKNFDMLEQFNTTAHLNPYPLTSKKNIRRSQAVIINYAKYYNNFNNYTDVTNSKTVQKRMSLLAQADANKVEIVVPGRTDYTVGQKVYLKLNKFNPIQATESNTDVLDKMFSGNYIIATCTHAIDREKHECHMQLIKDSYLMDLNNTGKR